MTEFLQSRDHDRPLDTSFPDNGKPKRSRRKYVSILSSSLLVRNKPSSAEGLMIDGHLECAMAHHETHLTISEDARVQANIHAGNVVVFGQLIGDIFSEGKVWLARGSEVEGDICCSCLYIEDGALFIGRAAVG